PAGNNGSGIYEGGLPLVGDFDGDGKQDLFQYNAGWKSIPVCLSSGDPATGAWSCSNLQARFDGGDYPAGNDGSGSFPGGFAFAADVDGDGKTDLVQYNPSWMSIPVCFSTGTAWSCKNLAKTPGGITRPGSGTGGTSGNGGMNQGPGTMESGCG